MRKKSAFKNDRFKKNRGGCSRLLALRCEHCGHHLATYQKDGPGILKRLYLDRIVAPVTLAVGRKNLVCDQCDTLLGVPIVYKKESRPAYRLFAGAVGKKIVQAKSNEE